MSVSISIQIDSAAAVASLAAVEAAALDRAGLHGAIAQATQKIVRDHLTAKYLPRDGPRGDFWADVIRSTQADADQTAATVSLTELGIALRYRGGEVTPGKSRSSYTGELTRALAIPSAAVPVAGGRQIRPGRAGILAFIRKATGGETVGFLVEGEEIIAKRGKNKGKPYVRPKAVGQLLYTLRTITRHRGDAGILPEEQALADSARAAIASFIASYESGAP